MFKKILDEYNKKTDAYTWTEQFRYINGKPWNFGERTYLKQIYTDPSTDKIFLKGRQVEGSELSINTVLHFLTTHDFTRCLYTFPSTSLCDKFCNDRIKQAFLQSAKLNEFLMNPGSVKTKEFKNGSYLYLVTASSGGDKARSIPADLLICDEYQDFEYGSEEDDSTPALDSLSSNLDASAHKRIIVLGTPKLPNTHFNELWDSSSQNIWKVVCQECHTHQEMSLENIIHLDKADVDPEWLYKTYFGCSNLKCSAPLDRSIGYWEPRNKKVIRSGYHIPQLIIPTKTSVDIVKAVGTKYHKGKTIRGLHNEVLGNFFAGSAIPFNDNVLQECFDTDQTVFQGCSDSEGTYLGVDWGDITTLCIIKYNRETDVVTIYAAKKLTDPHLNNHSIEIKNLIRPYQIRNTVVDIGYGKPQTQELMRMLPGRIWSCYSNVKVSQVEPYVFDKKTMKVQTDKSIMIGELVSRAELGCDRNGGLIIPYDDQARILLQPYLKEMQNIIAKQENNRTRYEKNSGKGDHFALALCYAIIAAKGDSRPTKHGFKSTGVRLGRK